MNNIDQKQLDREYDNAAFIAEFLNVSQRCWDNAEEKGFHKKERSFAEEIALMHSELSEALESDRHGDGPSDHIPDFKGSEEELADVIIRIMDSAQTRGLRVAQAIIAKMDFNAGRPYMHGKKF